MQNIRNTFQLKESILQLELKLAHQEIVLKEQFKSTYESIKPMNLIRNKMSELIVSPGFKGALLSTVVGIATGYLSKKLIRGAINHPVKQLAGTLLQMGVTAVISKNAGGIGLALLNLLSTISGKKQIK